VFLSEVSKLRAEKEFDVMNTQKLFEVYFENIRSLSTLFFSNGSFTLKLYGDAFNTSAPLLARESFSELSHRFPSCLALLVHRHSLVVDSENVSSDSEESDVLKFFCKNAGVACNSDSAVGLCPTPATRLMLEAGCFGLSDKVLITDDYDAERYFLLGTSVGGSFPQRILFCYSPVIELLESDSCVDTCDHRAVHTTLAIASECWPNAALAWQTRRHKWISNEVANIVASSTIYFVPKPISKSAVADKSQQSVFWKCEFCAAEDVLMKYLGFEIKVAYQLMLRLVSVHRLSCCCVSAELLIKHALFWCLDEMSAEADWNNMPCIVYYLHTLKTLQLFICRRHFPHYFMPNVNILCICDGSVRDISWIEKATADASAIPPEAELIQQILNCTDAAVTSSIACHLKAVYAYSVYMSYIQLFHGLHTTASTDHLIAKHHDILSYLHKSSSVSYNLLSKPLITWISSSLGVMYFVKACTSSGQCRTEYIENAEHCLLEAVAANNMPSCTLNFVHYLLHVKCYKEANLYMDALLASAEFTQPGGCSLVENCTSKASTFSEQLLSTFHRASCRIDVVFSAFEVSVLFPHLQSSLSFARCVNIGYDDSPVAVLKSEFWMQYIAVLCCRHRDVNRALKILDDAESRLVHYILPAVGAASDRSSITYFNILAGMFHHFLLISSVSYSFYWANDCLQVKQKVLIMMN